jgi:hypothetical protein
MSPQIPTNDSDEMRPEYDFSHGVRGRHHKAHQAGTNVVFLDPDIAAAFPDSASVNQALHLLMRLSKLKRVTGSRPNKTTHPMRRAQRKVKPRRRSGGT